MCLQRLDIYNVRNIQNQSIVPSTSFNFIYGKNASGKSALIEAIYLLGRAKSFRTSSIKSVITFNKPHLTIASVINKKNTHVLNMGIQMDGINAEIRINHIPNQKRIALAHALPVQILHPRSFELLDSSSKGRREFIDWGVFNHNADFLVSWRIYKKVLHHRNALLKLKSVKQLNVWNNELVNYGTIVNEFRIHYLELFKTAFKRALTYFLELNGVEVTLLPGWRINSTFQQELIVDLDKDLRYGFTHSGPHRGDFILSLGNKPAKEIVSRGQLKILVLCLKLAQVELIIKERNTFGCILIDDFCAELDQENRGKVLRYLKDLQCQVFITSAEFHDFGDLTDIKNHKVFHVEHGKIKEIEVPRGTFS